jgi:V8-like Glu-specific endopeptidase
MTWLIVAASGEANQLAELDKAARAIALKVNSPGDEPRVRSATSIEDLSKIRAEPHDTHTELIIITASLPEVPSSPNFKTLPGLALVKKLQADSSPPACILLSDDCEHREEVLGKRLQLLQVGVSTRYVDDCIELASELGVIRPAVVQPTRAPAADASDASVVLPEFAPSPSVDAQPAVADDGRYSVIELRLRSKAAQSTIELDVTYPGRTRRADPVPLSLKQSAVDKLLRDSRTLSQRFQKALQSGERYADWPSDYRALGERVYKLLDTSEFRHHYGYAQGVAGEDVRVRFNLEPALDDGLWESIYDPRTRKFLMLDSTIARRDSSPMDTSESGKRAGRSGILNVLVIAATVEDGAVPEGLDGPLWEKYWANHRLQALPHVTREIGELKRLEKLPRGAPIRVDVLDGSSGEPLHEAVERTLRDRPQDYDVVHFAGHVLFPPDKTRGAATGRRKPVAEIDSGYLIFSGPKPRAVPIPQVARWLKGTAQDPGTVELVFLSCCRSSSARAAAEFARNDVRMAIGFRWDLEDARTVDFARRFYEQLLLRRLRVCSAIRAARGSLNDDADDPIWAAPVLVAQPSKWGDVEGKLRPPERGKPQGTSRPATTPAPTQPSSPDNEMPNSDPDRLEISHKDRLGLIDRLAELSLNDDPAKYFRRLVLQANFSRPHRVAGTKGLGDDPKANALRLVDWALAINTNATDSNNKALATILVPLMPELGLEDQTFIAGLIVNYKLLASQAARDELGARFQIPRPGALAAAAAPATVVPVTWASETEELVLQGWFTPDPDWLDVGLLIRAAQRARSVCRVEVGATGLKGTGVLIAPNLVLTNYHVLGVTLDAPPSKLEENAASTVLRFGAFSATNLNAIDGQRVSLAANKPVVASNPQYDFALLRTDDDAIAKAADVGPFAQIGKMPALKDALYLLQHPQGGPMKLALNTNGVTWIDPGHITLQYTAKVAGGSSGSPCFDAQWNLVALHHAGSSSKGEGILMSSIFERIKEFLPK